MKPDVVVDIGNTRMKWGVCVGDRVTEVIRLPLDEPAAWDAALAKFPPPRAGARMWAAASVNPPPMTRFLSWSREHGDAVVFEKYTQLPIRLNVDEPDKVGIDRLLGAVAARAMTPDGTAAITVDVGTAVTVNMIDADGVFQGGGIFPGPRLMGRVLHDFTAKLPLIDPTEQPRDETFPPKNTAAAIRFGIDAALLGGVNTLISLLIDTSSLPGPPHLYLTGGACHLLDGCEFPHVAAQQVIPALTLEGIRIAAEALP
jgi:type III pantothenate kinase